MNKQTLLTGFFVYILSTVLSYFLFTKVILSGSIIEVPTPQPGTKDGVTVFDNSLPKTEPCPLNGVKYSKQQREWWEKHRPLGIMVENSVDARPQSGLAQSDVVYEAVAEGGITRFLAMFHCQDAGMVGPVRSARTYFMDFVSEYGDYPLYVHVGGANTPGPANALGQIADYGWQGYNDLNQFSIGFPTFWRDYDRLPTKATEHTMYTTTKRLWEYAAEDRELSHVNEEGDAWDSDFVEYSFKDDVPESKRPANQVVEFNFWDSQPNFLVTWTYDKATNSYLRANGGKKHTDRNNNKQLSAKNVVVLFMTESRANDGYEGNLHMLYGTIGTGDAKIFMDGKEIDATWAKKTRTSRLVLTDSGGDEIEFNRGRMWFAVVSPDTTVSVD